VAAGRSGLAGLAGENWFDQVGLGEHFFLTICEFMRIYANLREFTRTVPHSSPVGWRIVPPLHRQFLEAAQMSRDSKLEARTARLVDSQRGRLWGERRRMSASLPRRLRCSAATVNEPVSLCWRNTHLMLTFSHIFGNRVAAITWITSITLFLHSDTAQGPRRAGMATDGADFRETGFSAPWEAQGSGTVAAITLTILSGDSCDSIRNMIHSRPLSSTFSTGQCNSPTTPQPYDSNLR